jgi:DNA-binding PadR family transcriptional regulator
MPVEKEPQKSIKMTEKGYERLNKLKEILSEYYQKRFSMDDAILWLILRSDKAIMDLRKELEARKSEIQNVIENPLEVKTALDREIQLVD